MDIIVLEVLSVDLLRAMRTQLAYYIKDQFRDVRQGHLSAVDTGALEGYLSLCRVIEEKE